MVEEKRPSEDEAIEMPTPTAWPLLAAAGVTLGMSGLVTNGIVSIVGVCLFVAGAIGWFRDVLPHERHEAIALRPLAQRARVVSAVPQVVQHLRVGEASHRMRIPVEVHPYSAGLRGGLFGAIVMALLAMVFGEISHGSFWYPINLIAAAAMPSLADASTASLSTFQLVPFVLASLIHLTTALIVGVLYGLILPMVPRHPALVGGFVAPILWTGLLWASLGVINPALDERIEWRWFIASQIGFGLAAGQVVSRSEKIRTLQSLPFAARAGIEAPGLSDREDGAR